MLGKNTNIPKILFNILFQKKRSYEDEPNVALINATKALTDSLRDVLCLVEEVSRNPTSANLLKLNEAQLRFENNIRYLNAVKGGEIVDAASSNLLQEANRAAQAAIAQFNDEVLKLSTTVPEANERAGFMKSKIFFC